MDGVGRVADPAAAEARCEWFDGIAARDAGVLHVPQCFGGVICEQLQPPLGLAEIGILIDP